MNGDYKTNNAKMAANDKLNPPENQIVETKGQQGDLPAGTAQQIAADSHKEDALNVGSVDAGGSNAKPDAENPEEKPKPSKLKTLWSSVGLDAITLILMLKGSLPAVIGVAIYQSPNVAATYATIGYLVPIATILSVPILPRAKYFQVLMLNVLGTCFGSAVSLLGIWSGIQARNNTIAETSSAGYNSSQAAVCAVWLFFNIWISNLLRAKFPALQFTAIVYSILISVSLTYGSRYQTIEQAEAFQKAILEAFLSGFALSTGVALFIIPISSRKVVFGEMGKYIGAVQGTIKAQSAYLQSLEKSDMFSQSTEDEESKYDDKMQGTKRNKKKKNDKALKGDKHPEATSLKAAISGLTGLHGMLHGDLEFAKKEFAYGKLGPDDLDEIFQHFQNIMIPLIGMTTITDIFERFAERRGWTNVKRKIGVDEEAWDLDTDPESRAKSRRLWNDVMIQLHEPFATMSQAMDEGLQHAGLLLELVKPPKVEKGATNEADVEAKGDIVRPGEEGFMEYMENKITLFYSKRGHCVRAWAREKGLSVEQWDSAKSPGVDGPEVTPDELQHRRDQQQLYLILFMEFLITWNTSAVQISLSMAYNKTDILRMKLYSTGKAILDLIRFADKKVADGVMKKSKFIHPGSRRIRAWLTSLGSEDTPVDSSAPDSIGATSNTISFGAGFEKKRNPEHLPATTTWEKIGNRIRTIPHFLGSEESAFGLRVALATMSIGIVSFLEKSQIFFIEQRLVWAMIMTAIGMSVTAGQSVFGFLVRIAGTVIATVLSITIWYIVDQKTAGAIVFLWLSIFILFYFLLKFPRFIQTWIIAIVTQILIIAYELQVEVVGVAKSTATGQPFYPIYELAPYRLATVSGGLFVAFIWTFFPYPLTDRSWLRRDLGASIYLLANYYSIVHSTIGSRFRQTGGDMDDEKSPGRQLQKIRHKIFGELLLILPSLHDHTEWQKWEPTLGGKFPRETYESIIQRLTNIMNHMALISYATRIFERRPLPDSEHAWLDDLTRLMGSINPSSHGVTSTLVLLSASIQTGSALPPYLQLPKAFELSRRLEQLDNGILSSKHIEEAGYSAYAVMQVSSSMMMDEVRGLASDVTTLVGEVDFTFRVESVEEVVKGKTD